MKYIFVTGGVLSGLGKGITAASIGNLLKRRGFSVNLQKFDQYINFDAGTLNPAEHGEVFVTDDGAECDLDLGHYERFLNRNLTQASSIMTGRVYQEVIASERAGEYLGKTVQVIPHVTDKCKAYAEQAASDHDIHIVEIGGTVGDNEGFHFLEAARQMRQAAGPGNVLYVHVVFLPYLKASDEVKTKPAQNSVRELRNIGIQPDIIIARTDHDVEDELLEKLSLFSNVAPEAILPLSTVPNVYSVPLYMEDRKLDQVILNQLNLESKQAPDPSWRNFINELSDANYPDIKLGLVGKYTTMLDTYASLVEALKAASWANQKTPVLRWIDAEELEKNPEELKQLDDLDGVIVPGGFGQRGTEGKISAIQYARENNIPFLGICLGLQLAVIEFARNVAGIKHATSQEFAPAPKDAEPSEQQDWIINIMEDQKNLTTKGGTMRLGGWDCKLKSGSKTEQAYGTTTIRERHRHRYEVNNTFRHQLEQAGMLVAGTTPDDHLVEVIELSNHPWFVAVQFHPEFTSRPDISHPLFKSFIASCSQR